jgi:hypothetical protein
MHTTKTHDRVEEQLHLCFISALDGISGPAQAPDGFIPQERAPGSYWIVGWPLEPVWTLWKRGIPVAPADSWTKTPVPSSP